MEISLGVEAWQRYKGRAKPSRYLFRYYIKNPLRNRGLRLTMFIEI